MKSLTFLPWARIAADVRFLQVAMRVADRQQKLWPRVAVEENENAPCVFEARCADAFRSLGFSIKQLGQGCGRLAEIDRLLFGNKIIDR